jgi:hypothetical protein
LKDRIPHLLVKVNVVAELFQHLPEVHPLYLRTGDRKFKLTKNTTTKFLKVFFKYYILFPICRQPPLSKKETPRWTVPYRITRQLLPRFS